MADRDRIQEELDELFADLCQVSRFTGLRQGFRPRVDSFLSADPPLLTVVVELPGLDPETIQLVVDERMLLVAGERPRPSTRGATRFYQQMELDYGAFQRRVQLPQPVDVDAATARYERGLLTVELPLVPQRAHQERAFIHVRLAP
jgi:HSP20 family molecular chaperone IbpA